MKKLLALAFALMLIFSVALADEPLTIAVSMRSTASEYHMQYVAGAELFAASLPEGTAVVQALPCEGNDDKQINDINALIAGQDDLDAVDAVAGATVTSGALKQAVQYALEDAAE